MSTTIRELVDDALTRGGVAERGKIWAFAERWYPTVAGPFQARGAIGSRALAHWRIVLVELDPQGRSAVLAEPVDERANPGWVLSLVSVIGPDEASALINATHLPYVDRIEEARGAS